MPFPEPARWPQTADPNSLLRASNTSCHPRSAHSTSPADCSPIRAIPPESILVAPTDAEPDKARLDSIATHSWKPAGCVARSPSRASVRAQSSSRSAGPRFLAPGQSVCSWWWSPFPSVNDRSLCRAFATRQANCGVPSESDLVNKSPGWISTPQKLILVEKLGGGMGVVLAEARSFHSSCGASLTESTKPRLYRAEKTCSPY